MQFLLDDTLSADLDTVGFVSVQSEIITFP